MSFFSDRNSNSRVLKLCHNKSLKFLMSPLSLMTKKNYSSLVFKLDNKKRKEAMENKSYVEKVWKKVGNGKEHFLGPPIQKCRIKRGFSLFVVHVHTFSFNFFAFVLLTLIPNKELLMYINNI